jgi:hypothetical protein
MKGKTTPLLRDCPPSKAFTTVAGQVFRNYADLLDGLKRMEDRTFDHHVNHDGNHFKNWVQHLWSDDKLAKEFDLHPQRLKMANAVSQRIRSLAERHG